MGKDAVFFLAADGAITFVWVVLMIVISIVSSILKKRKQAQQLREPADEAVKPVYTARKEDVKAFLRQLSGEPPLSERRTLVKPKESPPPMRAVATRKPVESVPLEAVLVEEPSRTTAAGRVRQGAPRRASAVARAVPAAAASRRIDPAVSAVFEKRRDTEIRDPVRHLSLMQRVVVWREILGPPPGLRSDIFRTEA